MILKYVERISAGNNATTEVGIKLSRYPVYLKKLIVETVAVCDSSGDYIVYGITTKSVGATANPSPDKAGVIGHMKRQSTGAAYVDIARMVLPLNNKKIIPNPRKRTVNDVLLFCSHNLGAAKIIVLTLICGTRRDDK